MKLKAMMKIRHQPWFLHLWYKREEHPLKAKRVVRRGDALVLDGYPRSANTFATHAMFMSQGDDLRMGNHMHNPAQFTLAARYGIPAILVLREPVAACASHMLQRGWTDPADALLRYIAFHRDLPSTDNFVVAPFEEVTTNFGKSIARCNRRFETDFTLFKHSDKSRDMVFDHVMKAYDKRQEHFGEGHHKELGKSIPTDIKKQQSDNVKKLFDNASVAKLRAKAEGLHHALKAQTV